MAFIVDVTESNFGLDIKGGYGRINVLELDNVSKIVHVYLMIYANEQAAKTPGIPPIEMTKLTYNGRVVLESYTPQQSDLTQEELTSGTPLAELLATRTIERQPTKRELQIFAVLDEALGKIYSLIKADIIDKGTTKIDLTNAKDHFNEKEETPNDPAAEPDPTVEPAAGSPDPAAG